MGENLNVILQQGGIREFERTGVYPEYLFFNLLGTKQSWRIRIKQKPQQGVLKSKGAAAYEYSFDGHFCQIRKVNSDGSFSVWMELESISIEMRD